MLRGKELHNILPEWLKDHQSASKYQYIDYDEDLGIPIRPTGFHVDCFPGSFLLPQEFNAKYDVLEALKNQKMEEGDYLLCCPSKTGQHWVWEIMKMLIAGSAEYMNNEKESSWVDIDPLEVIYSRYDSSRVLCSHLSPGWVPESFRLPDTKVVVTLRNLKDAFVSYYHHYSYYLGDQALTWPQTFRKLMYSKYCSFGNYFDLYADIWDNSRYDPNVLLVFYEDLKRKPAETIEKIARHMGVNYNSTLITEVTDAVRFNKLKAAKDRMNKNPFVKQSLYRKGEIGGWKELFTHAQNEEFERVWRQWNKKRQIPFVYE